MKVLIIEDNEKVAREIAKSIQAYYVVDLAQSGESGFSRAITQSYSAFIISLALTDVDPFDICNCLREEQIKIPIIVLGKTNQASERIKALNSGADFYLVKPFNSQELKASLKAVLRRQTNNLHPVIIKTRDLILDTNKQKASYQARELNLSRKEFMILELLMKNVGKVVSRFTLIEQVWSDNSDFLTNTVDVHVSSLRKKIDPNKAHKIITTIHGTGYMIDE